MTGRTIYAIGDVHGYADELETLLDFVRRDSAMQEQDPVVYFVGDIIDRGPDSKRAVQLVVDVLSEFPGSVWHLGNHDDWLQRALDHDLDFNEMNSWLGYNCGGEETLKSYGGDRLNYLNTLEAIKKNHPDHVEALKKTRLYSQHGGFVFCHAGIQRGIPMQAQDKETLIWTREEFLFSDINDGLMVVHGHTPTEHGLPEVSPNRINLDTGVFFCGILTCMVLDLDTERIHFVQTEAGKGNIDEVSPIFVDMNGNKTEPSE